MEQQLLNFLTSDNNLRNQAMSEVEQQCSTRPDDFAQSLCAFLLNSTPNSNPQMEVQRLQLREISSLILHKNLLSKDNNFTRISQNTLVQISESVFSMVASGADSMNWGLLKRCSEILVEIAVKCNQVQPFFQKIKNFQLDVFGTKKDQKGFVKLCKFGLYCLELICEFAGESPSVQQGAGEFLMIFEASFSCGNDEIKSFATGAICMFLVSQTPEALGNNFQNILEGLVNVLVESIKGIQKYYH
jgi:hypothetical protein